jgi:hypothetical protein
MGSAGSKSKNTVSIDLSTSISNISKKLTENTNKTTTVAANSQDFTLVVGGDIIGTRLKLGQKISVSTKISGGLTSDNKTQLSNDIKSTLSAAMTQAADAQAGVLATGSAKSENDTKINNALNVALTDVQITKNINEAFTSTFNKQNSTIVIGGSIRDSDLDFTQDISTQILVKNILDSSIKDINSALVASGSDITVDQSAKTKTAGWDDLMNSIFGGLMWPIIISVIASVISVVVLLIVFNQVAQSDAGQSAIKTAANTGQMYATGGGSAFVPKSGG